MWGNGYFVTYKNDIRHVSAVKSKMVIDTTGAGDCFFGCCLNKLSKKKNFEINIDYLEEVARFAGAAASIIVERKGALCQMPIPVEIEERISLQ